MMMKQYTSKFISNTNEKDVEKFLELYYQSYPDKKNVEIQISGHFIEELENKDTSENQGNKRQKTIN